MFTNKDLFIYLSNIPQTSRARSRSPIAEHFYYLGKGEKIKWHKNATSSSVSTHDFLVIYLWIYRYALKGKEYKYFNIKIKTIKIIM